MNADVTNIFNKMMLLSKAIQEVIVLDNTISEEFKYSIEDFRDRDEYLSFWLRSQSFFISAKSLTDSKFLNDAYNLQTTPEWRFGVKALRHFFAHELNFIPSLHHAVTFIPQEKISVSMSGFVFDSQHLFSILRQTSKNEARQAFKKKKTDQLTIGVIRLKLVRDRKRNLKIVNDWGSKPNHSKILISDIATRHYLIAYSIFTNRITESLCVVRKRENYNAKSSEMSSLNRMTKAIENTALLVKNYRAEKCNW